MARPLKTGLSYFPFDVDFFTDIKIKRLRARYGTDGIAVYIYILCQIYRNGYYVEYSDDFILDISDELKLSENSTTQILNYLFSRSLLQVIESKLAVPVKVITASSVQRRYQEAKKGAKRDIDVEPEFWVLKAEETESFIKVRPLLDCSEKNHSKSEKNYNKSEKNDIKERKENKSKGKESIKPAEPSDSHTFKGYGKYGHVRLTDMQYKALISDFGETVVTDYIRKIDEWVQLKGKRYNDYEIALRQWIAQDNATDKSDFDVEKYKAFINKF